MPHRHYPPAYLRYLRAKLWNLGRPGFWGNCNFFICSGASNLGTLSNADIFVYKQKNKVYFTNPY